MNGKEEVWAKVEAFRARHLVGDLAHLPVDVFTLAELGLHLDIIPFDDLFEKYEADAALMHDFTGLYVDAEAYVLWEKGPRWKQRRLRFSVAHEIGHYVLHREIAAKNPFHSMEEFAAWTRGYLGRQFTCEQAANEFAGRLLVPEARLRREFEDFIPRVQPVIPHWQTSTDVRRQFAESLVRVFEVNAQVIEARLDREGIWPAS